MFLAPSWCECFAQLRASPMEHDPEIAFRDVERGANLVPGTFLDFVQLKRLCDARRQVAQGQFERRAKLLQVHPPVRTETLCGGLMQPDQRFGHVVRVGCRVPVEAREQRMTILGPEMVVNLMAEDTHEPGS